MSVTDGRVERGLSMPPWRGRSEGVVCAYRIDRSTCRRETAASLSSQSLAPWSCCGQTWRLRQQLVLVQGGAVLVCSRQSVSLLALLRVGDLRLGGVGWLLGHVARLYRRVDGSVYYAVCWNVYFSSVSELQHACSDVARQGGGGETQQDGKGKRDACPYTMHHHVSQAAAVHPMR